MDAIAAGRGAVVVTGHIGSWDIAAKVLCEKQCRVHVVMGRETDASTAEFVEGVRRRAGVDVVVPEGSVFSSLGLVRALRRNEIVAIQLDRAAAAGGVRMLPFLGALAPFPSGPFVLSRLTGAPVIPVFAPRLGRRHYAIRIGRPVEVPRGARDPRVLGPRDAGGRVPARGRGAPGIPASGSSSSRSGPKLQPRRAPPASSIPSAPPAPCRPELRRGTGSGEPRTRRRRAPPSRRTTTHRCRAPTR